MCDINVAMSYLSVTGVIPFFIARFANFFAWLFYYPSQVLISNSSIITQKNRKKPEKTLKTKCSKKIGQKSKRRKKSR
jgi:hypothetical protein